MKTAYIFDSSGRFLREHVCQIDVFGEVLLPENSTTVDPGIDKHNQRWNGTSWETVDRTETVQYNYMKQIRDDLLLKSDIYVLPDRWEQMTLDKRAEWAAYRQALREITKQEGFPDNVVWPTKPE